MEKPPLPEGLPLDRLLLDTENPRVEVQASQKSSIKALLESQTDSNGNTNKIIELATSIAHNGFNTAESLMVLPHKDKFIVLERNRRLLALKLLRNPELADTIVSKRLMTRLREAAGAFSFGENFLVPCVRFESREEADPFIYSRHTGENKGAGLVNWDRREIGRYKERLGNKPLDLQIVDFLRESSVVPKEVKAKLNDVPGTTLVRFVKDKRVRDNLGLNIKDGKLDTDSISQKALEVLSMAANDLATRAINVNNVRNSDDRLKYLNSLEARVSAPNAKTTEPSTSTGKAKITTRTKTKRPVLKSSKDRTTVIPTDCILHIPHPRLNDIYIELMKINVHDFPNLSSVMLRVFLELSLDEYIPSNVTWKKGKYSERIHLHDKIKAVEEHMRDNGIMDEQELLPIERASSNENWLCSKNTLHGFVHNRHYHPVPADILTIWNNFQNLFEKMWPQPPAASQGGMA